MFFSMLREGKDPSSFPAQRVKYLIHVAANSEEDGDPYGLLALFFVSDFHINDPN